MSGAKTPTISRPSLGNGPGPVQVPLRRARAVVRGDTDRMRNLISRLRGKPSTSAQTMSLGASLADSFAKGLQNPEPLTPEELANVAAYAEHVAKRTFWTLYDDED